jgi:hypothetical protein
MNTNTCSTCRFWAEDSIKRLRMFDKVIVDTNERLCNRSKWMNFPAYGQDGKPIITCANFGCNQWSTKD